MDNDDPPYQPAAYDESYAYDKIGNLTSKAGVSQQYGSNLNGTGAGPHQVRSRGGASYSYDANGNLQSGGNRSYMWTYENQIASVTVTNYNPETYAYNADGERVVRATSTVATVYEGGLYEHDVQTGRTRVLYTLNDQAVAQRTRATGENNVHYMHSDHLGSVSVTTDAQGAVVSRADFKPFGEERSWSGTNPTTLNFTGQRKDATGLLFYNARYYDPMLGRFVSTDSTGIDSTNPQTRNRYS